MQFPNGGAAIVQALYERFRPLAEGNDDDRRALTRIIAQTFCARFGAEWGTKATYPHYPQSKDAIAFGYPSGSIDIWDWQNGATRAPQVRDGAPPTYPDARTKEGNPQAFIRVDAYDHLAPPSQTVEEVHNAPPPATPPPPAATDQLQKLIDKVQLLVDVIAVSTEVQNVLIKRLEKLQAEGVRVHL
jgi:hypothetical protein